MGVHCWLRKAFRVLDATRDTDAGLSGVRGID